MDSDPSVASLLQDDGLASLLQDDGLASSLHDDGLASPLQDDGLASLLRGLARARVLAWLVFAATSGVAGCVTGAIHTPSQSAANPRVADEKRGMLIHAYASGLSGVHATNPNLKLSVGRDPAMGDEQVLLVDYPAPSDDPAGRDVHLEAENQDWTGGRAIAFQIKPAKAIGLSVSFLDRNHVAYTSWTTLQGNVWQSVRIPFDEIRPNPYFQPPGAKTGVPIDVSAVSGIAFAPQDQASGRLSISQIVVVK